MMGNQRSNQGLGCHSAEHSRRSLGEQGFLLKGGRQPSFGVFFCLGKLFLLPQPEAAAAPTLPPQQQGWEGMQMPFSFSFPIFSGLGEADSMGWRQFVYPQSRAGWGSEGSRVSLLLQQLPQLEWSWEGGHGWEVLGRDPSCCSLAQSSWQCPAVPRVCHRDRIRPGTSTAAQTHLQSSTCWNC